MITENLSTLKIHKLTQAQYDRELAAGRIDANALYLTPDGSSAFSPTASVEQTDNGAVITITDKNGTTTAVVTNGEQGEPGPQGIQGEKGEQGPKGDPGTTDYAELTNTPVIPSSISAVEHQYTVSNSKDSISDASTWNSVSNPLTQRQRACVYGNGYYVVCGTSGEMAYSLDGVTWTSIAKFTSDVITGIAYGKGIFVAIDSAGVIWIANETPFNWEPLSVTWEQLESGAVQILEGICYANNRFVLVGDYGLVAFSDNGRTWTEIRTAYDFKAVTFGKGRYIGAGNSGAVAVSYDGENWTDYSEPSITGSYRAAAFGAGRYVVGCQGGIIRFSDDGRTWTTATTNSTSTVNYIRGIVYAEGKFYAVMYVSTGKGEIWVSDDAETWTVQQVASGRLWCCCAGDGILIASGDNGYVYVLDFGLEWMTKQPELAEGQYLWERIVLTLSDGGQIIGDGVCIGGAVQIGADDVEFSDGETFQQKYDSGDLKGDKGDTGEQGPIGPQGIQGIQGIQGDPGKTPVKGTDYWTDADKAEMVENVKTSLTPADIGAAPESHASSANTYGIGNGTVYGHVKLSDKTAATDGVGAGVAATPYAVKQAYARAATLMNRSTNVNAADTNYTTLMARGTSLNSADTTPAVNGAIAWTYK